MKINLIVVGKTTDPHLQSLINDYQNRLQHYIPFTIQVIPELKNARNLTTQQQKETEGKLILQSVSSSVFLILLDEHGKQYRSIQFADYLQKIMSSGKDITLVVGGPFGFSEDVYNRADAQLSLSLMTFSHQMVRLFAVEQLYRAMTILKGEKYHHE
ncbi:MAG: 23S rRNA (pseudouridine(1915)-N(3))-methyltransferase RlmH [Paludibacteraceae bacterium]|nr:23S rRNA (pseudouridine(1915)-N(3))-methyltransferase RlmH [Paludibacteraceae bacterium]